MGNLLLVLLIFFLVLLYFWLLLPRIDRGRRQTCLSYAAWDFAHRGLWDMEQGIPENSIPSFERAIRQNAAIELDVRLTKDKQLVVIHDSSLKRLCRTTGFVELKTYRELASLRLCGTDNGIPLLGQALRCIRGEVPVLIDIKTTGSDTSICSYLYKELEFYNGGYMVQSFNPFVLRWFRRHAPHVLTGQLAGSYASLHGYNPVVRLAMYLLLVNGISRPDFISYELRGADCLSVRIVHSLYRTPVFIWTARSMNDYRQARALFSSVIFERFLP